jgi:2-polyprenyl-3-methyl-5-hydroxy-6-metoxy-1,4-benzoquinol methylase
MKKVTYRFLREIYFQSKWLFLPGFDLHTRCRYKKLPSMFKNGGIRTLDAGCGNGCLAFAAGQLGNKVLGISIDHAQVANNSEFYNWLGQYHMQFETCSLYDLKILGRRFDQIICSETLEHISRDKEVIRIFLDILTNTSDSFD